MATMRPSGKAESLLNPDAKLKHSRFAFLFRKDNRYALYHSILQHVIYLDPDAKSLFANFYTPTSIRDALSNIRIEDQRNVSSLIQLLAEKKLLVSCSDTEDTYMDALCKNTAVDIKLMYLIITDACNLRCGYCFIENSLPASYKHKYMDVGTSRKAIDLFLTVSKKEDNKTDARKIIFYGGEPLLNACTFIDSVSYVRSKQDNEDLDITLITNGVAMTDEIASCIAKYNVRVSLSVDGPELVNNQARIYQDGEGCYGQIYAAYKMLKSVGIHKISLSITIGRHNVFALRESIEELLKVYDVEAVGFNFLIDFPHGKNPFSVPIELATQSALEAFEYLRIKGIYEDRIMRKLKPFTKSTFHLRDCGGIGNQIVIAPNGLIGPCQAFLTSSLYFNHHVDEGTIDFSMDPIYQEWARRMPVNMQECQNCPAISVCGGGCPYQAHITTGSIWSLDERMCVHNRAFIEWAVWDAGNFLQRNTATL